MSIVLKRNDSDVVIPYTLVQDDGTPINLTGCTVSFLMGKLTKLIVDKPATITNTALGEVEYVLQADDTLIAGDFSGEFSVLYPDGKRQTFPSEGYIPITINPNIDNGLSSIVADDVARIQGNFDAKLDLLLANATGNSNAEVVAARGAYGTVGSRLDANDTAVVGKYDKSKILESTTTYYVSTTGSDTNNGTTVGTAFATLQKAFDTLAQIYTVVHGILKIDIQAGTYNQISSIPAKLITKERLQIVGKKDGNGIPTVIFDGTGFTSGSGVFGQEKDFLTVQDIKFQNYRNASLVACGVHVQHGANLWCNNVHAYNCDFGISVTGNTRLYVQGGILDGCRFGVRHYSNCVGTIGYNGGGFGLGTVIRNCTQVGVYFQNASSGHVDYCVIDGNIMSGVGCVNQSRAHVMQCDIKNNGTEGVYLYHQSTWMNDGNVFTNNAKNWRHTAFSSELSLHGDARATLQTHIDVTQKIHTGTLTNTNLKNGLVIPAGTFVDAGRKLKVLATGTFTGAGTKDVSFRTTSGILQNFVSANGSIQNWRMEMDLYAVSATSQKHSVTFFDGTVGYSHRYFTRNYDFNTSQTIQLWGMLSDVTGSIIVETFEIQEVI